MNGAVEPINELLGISFGRFLPQLDAVFTTFHMRTSSRDFHTVTQEPLPPVLIPLDTLVKLYGELSYYSDQARWQLQRLGLSARGLRPSAGPTTDRLEPCREAHQGGVFLACTSLRMSYPDMTGGDLVIAAVRTRLDDEMEFVITCEVSPVLGYRLQVSIRRLFNSLGDDIAALLPYDDEEEEEEEEELTIEEDAERRAEAIRLLTYLEQVSTEAIARHPDSGPGEAREQPREVEVEVEQSYPLNEKTGLREAGGVCLHFDPPRLVAEESAALFRFATSSFTNSPDAFNILMPLRIVELLAECMPTTVKQLRKLAERNNGDDTESRED